ncbi:MAG: hypothetical protein H6637_07785 [Ardenticatenales bacterium]|nr:hypothetical protein [Ardenticatenales bacterium]
MPARLDNTRGDRAGARVQMGNLRGVYGYAGTIYGIAMGDPTAANVTVEAIQQR